MLMVIWADFGEFSARKGCVFGGFRLRLNYETKDESVGSSGDGSGWGSEFSSAAGDGTWR